MSSSGNVVEVNEADFDYEVLAFSQKAPVIVDFWAEWCGPCKTLGPILVRMAEEAKGAFRLAKINVDHNQSLVRRYNIRSIPAVKGFRDGRVVAEFLGAQSELRVREFIQTLTAVETDLLLEKGKSLLDSRHYQSAERCFRQFLEESKNHPQGMLGLLKSLVLQGEISEAQSILEYFPDGKEFAAADAIRPVLRAMMWALSENPSDDDHMEAAYQRALHLVSRGNLPAAMDGILEILRQDKRFRKDEARKVMLGLLELMGNENPQSRQYRNELAQVLF
jgi:putative thioredoxin